MRAKTARMVIGLLAVTNLVLLAGVIAIAASPSARDAIAARLSLATEDEQERLEGRVSELESTVGDTLGIDDLSSRVDELEVRLDDLATGSGDEAAMSVDDLASQLDDTESRLYDSEYQLDDLESRLEELDTRITNLCFSLPFEFDVDC